MGTVSYVLFVRLFVEFLHLVLFPLPGIRHSHIHVGDIDSVLLTTTVFTLLIC